MMPGRSQTARKYPWPKCGARGVWASIARALIRTAFVANEAAAGELVFRIEWQTRESLAAWHRRKTAGWWADAADCLDVGARMAEYFDDPKIPIVWGESKEAPPIVSDRLSRGDGEALGD